MTIRYAIGDIHGEAERLARLHEAIAAHHALFGGDALLVHVGDLVDRGPDSRSVVQRVMDIETAPPAGMRACCVLGNHEQMMLDAIAKPDRIEGPYWLEQGGGETLESYERVNGACDPWRDAIDHEHIVWLARLPTMIRDATYVFVHGGIDPARFPHCPDELRLWTRSNKFFDESRWPRRPELEGLLVVHGHTPTDDFRPDVNPRRINIDTGVAFGGPLTCVILTPGEAPRFLSA